MLALICLHVVKDKIADKKNKTVQQGVGVTLKNGLSEAFGSAQNNIFQYYSDYDNSELTVGQIYNVKHYNKKKEHRAVLMVQDKNRLELLKR